MGTTFRQIQRVFAFLLVTVAMTACGSDNDSADGDDGNIKPGVTVNDPEGTVSLSMMKGNAPNETTTIPDTYIYVGNDYNFNYGEFVSLGTVKGLGNVTHIPTIGWASSMRVQKNNGYVAYSNGHFVRIFVEDEIVSTSGGVIGYDVKYQSPFKGKDIDLEIPTTSLSFNKDGGTENIVLDNKEFVVFTAKSSESWCQIQTTSTYGQYFLSNGLNITVLPSNVTETTEATITLTTAYGKKKEIKVTRSGVDPYINLNNTLINFDAKSANTEIGINTNIQKENIEIINNISTWCEAEIVDNTRVMHANASKIKFVGNKPVKAVKSSGNATSYSLKLTASANDKDEERNGKITLKTKDGKNSVTVNITQKKGYLYVSELQNGNNIMGAYNNASTTEITVYSNLDNKDIQVSSSETWCEPIFNELSYWRNLSIKLDANKTDKSRDAEVTISNKAKTMKYTFIVRQDGTQFNPSQTKVGFDKNSTNKTLVINSKLDWEASSDQNWCSVSKNGNNLTIRVTAYSGNTASRKATISFKGLSTKIYVDQSKYAVGEEYNENGVKGEVAYMDDTIRYVRKYVGTSAWSTENVAIGATYDNDGTKNMDIVKKIAGWKDLYPAFALCDALNKNGVKGWYLPAKKEILWRQDNENNWSSTEHSATYAYYAFNSINYKSEKLKIYAIHKF